MARPLPTTATMRVETKPDRLESLPQIANSPVALQSGGDAARADGQVGGDACRVELDGKLMNYELAVGRESARAPNRVLVIEDNRTSLHLLAYLLRAFGHMVLTAEDGDEGLEIAVTEVPDIILCDIGLPTVDGFDVVKRLRYRKAMQNVPVVAVSALVRVGERERLMAAGFDGYISKPVDPVTFAPQVAAILKYHRSREPRAIN